MEITLLIGSLNKCQTKRVFSNRFKILVFWFAFERLAVTLHTYPRFVAGDAEGDSFALTIPTMF